MGLIYYSYFFINSNNTYIPLFFKENKPVWQKHSSINIKSRFYIWRAKLMSNTIVLSEDIFGGLRLCNCLVWGATTYQRRTHWRARGARRAARARARRAPAGSGRGWRSAAAATRAAPARPATAETHYCYIHEFACLLLLQLWKDWRDLSEIYYR